MVYLDICNTTVYSCGDRDPSIAFQSLDQCFDWNEL